MAGRHTLDFRLWTPWSDRARATFERTAQTAWANPLHPASEGRRAAVWLDAMAATVSGFFGGGHVEFFPHRESAMSHLIAAHAGARILTAGTNRKPLLSRVPSVPVDGQGQAQWQAADVVILQYGNEETGVIDHYAGSAVRILDATNALGRMPIQSAWDFLVGSARAWGAPVDIAFVVSVKPLPMHPIPALPDVAVAVTELEHAWGAVETNAQRTETAMRDFEHRVRDRLPDAAFHGSHRVPHMRSLSIRNLDAETLMRELDTAGYAVGAGSACSVDLVPSHVLQAMDVTTDGNIRIALPIGFDLDELPGFADVLADTVARLRREAGVA